MATAIIREFQLASSGYPEERIPMKKVNLYLSWIHAPNVEVPDTQLPLAVAIHLKIQ